MDSAPDNPDTEAKDTAAAATPTSAGATEEIVRRYLAAFATGDPDTVAACVAPGFVNEHTAALGSGCVGRVAYRERLPGFLAGMANLVYEVEDVVAEGSRAVATYTMRADWEGRVPIEVRGAQRLVVDADGLIAHRTDYWDSAVFLVQADPAAAEALAAFGIG
jgi:ketosteroid isomerase-like protein